MATTTNYNLEKPSIGSVGWGEEVNANFDTIDSQMKDNADAAAAKLPLSGGSIAGNLIVAGDIYTNAWADYSATSTIVGWASFTAKEIYTKKVGKLVFVNFAISGTSDSDPTNGAKAVFTLPYTSASAPTGATAFNLTATYDAGTTTTVPGGGSINASSTTVNLNKVFHTAAGWTNSGTKTVRGQFWYQEA
jgi:hypothetical protein